jgi:hypothetical protein
VFGATCKYQAKMETLTTNITGFSRLKNPLDIFMQSPDPAYSQKIYSPFHDPEARSHSTVENNYVFDKSLMFLNLLMFFVELVPNLRSENLGTRDFQNETGLKKARPKPRFRKTGVFY